MVQYIRSRKRFFPWPWVTAIIVALLLGASHYLGPSDIDAARDVAAETAAAPGSVNTALQAEAKFQREAP